MIHELYRPRLGDTTDPETFIQNAIAQSAPAPIDWEKLALIALLAVAAVLLMSQTQRGSRR